MTDDNFDEYILFRIVITAAGPNWREKFMIEDRDRAELDPTIVTKLGYDYERYGDEDNYVEVRLDYIVARDFTIVTVKPGESVLDIERQLGEPPPISSLTRTDREERHER